MKRALLIAGGTVGGLGAVLSITPPHLGVAATSVSSLASGTTTSGAPQTDTSSATPVSSPSTSTSATASSTPSATASTTVSTTTPTPKKSTVSTPSTPKATPKAATTKKASAAPSATKTTTSSTPSTPASTPASTPSQTPTPTPTKTTATPAPVASGVSGSFTGGTYDAAQNGRLWGAVTVTVTLKNGEISNISAVQNPSSRGYNAFSYLTPAVLTQKLSVKTVMSITPTALVAQIRGYTGASYSSFAYWQSLQSALSKAGL